MRTNVIVALVVGACLCFSATMFAAPSLVAPTSALTPDAQLKTFKLPPGFEIQLVAADPDISKPMNIAFDARGRLWVTDTIEYPFPAPPDRKPRDTVRILSDFDDTGRARKVTTFAEGLNIPLGILPLTDGRNGAIVFSIPDIKLMLDTDGDDRCDKIEVLIGGFGSKDTHGMTNNFVRGFDGWIYADHGFSNTSKITGTDGSQIEMQSGNVYRFRPDGSKVEFFTRGQVNPFGLCFDPRGDLYSADCHTRPQYMLLRGAHYPSFGKPHDGLGFGPEMCTHSHGSTAIAGTCYYAAEHFPAEYRGNLFNGNPVTARVNRDRIEWTGSTPKAVEMPDLLSSDDPWFRPVQVTLGPDGAIWVADFYNKIIGHYEVDLKHPGRDRTRGRIWRIVYRGADGKGPVPKVPDLAAMNVEQLVAALGDPNLVVRMTATHLLADGKHRATVADALHKAIAAPRPPEQVVHAAWAMSRGAGDGLRHFELDKAATHADALVRVHVMRILATHEKWSDPHVDYTTTALADADPFVRRAAAEAIGLHPSVAGVRALLSARQAADPQDSHLVHTIRVALRNSLRESGMLAKLSGQELKDVDRKVIGEILPAIPGEEAGAFVVTYLKNTDADAATTAALLRHAARHVPQKDLDGLATLATGRFGNDFTLQLELMKAVREGLTQRGVAPSDGIRAWGHALAGKVLTPGSETQVSAWTSHSLPGAPRGQDPWAYQQRPCADGLNTDLFSSHPRGESLTGMLRSRTFEIPAKLSFYLCGHNGLPPGKRPIKNVVRLRAEGSDDVLVEVAPPRNDTAQKITWDLAAHAGRRGYIEVVDGDTADAYAWLAFGRIEPAVVPMPAERIWGFTRQQESACEIAGWLRQAELAPALADLAIGRNTDAALRAAAAKALAQIDPGAAATKLAAPLADATADAKLREAAAAALGGIDTPEARAALVTAFATAPNPLQRSIALSLAGNTPGGEALLDAVAAGKASPRLLQDKAVQERLKAAKVRDLDGRVTTLTKGLISLDEATQKLIGDRRKSFDAATASAERGKAVFAKNCAACHRIGEEGGNIAPQLDGSAKRGVDRLIEDILDPSRNVDAAFRTSIVVLADGDVQSGLFRREEGATLVFANTTGKEFTVPKAQVQKRTDSPLSLMPGNLGELMKPEEFNDLLAYLMSK